VIRRVVSIVLALLVLLAAGLMTAIFIFRRPTTVEFRTATPSQCSCPATRRPINLLAKGTGEWALPLSDGLRAVSTAGIG
jgi:hypothetical protein